MVRIVAALASIAPPSWATTHPYPAHLHRSGRWPARKSRTIALRLPTMKTAADVAVALGAVAGGEITPDEGAAVACNHCARAVRDHRGLAQTLRPDQSKAMTTSDL